MPRSLPRRGGRPSPRSWMRWTGTAPPRTSDRSSSGATTRRWSRSRTPSGCCSRDGATHHPALDSTSRGGFGGRSVDRARLSLRRPSRHRGMETTGRRVDDRVGTEAYMQVARTIANRLRECGVAESRSRSEEARAPHPGGAGTPVRSGRDARGLHDAGVRFVLIGGMAAVLHGDVGVTVDIDIAPARDPGNLERLAGRIARPGRPHPRRRRSGRTVLRPIRRLPAQPRPGRHPQPDD